MIHDAQTHRMPKTEEGLARVACLMDLDPAALISQIKSRLTEVHGLTEDFFAPEHGSGAAPLLSQELNGDVIARWPTYPALRSARGARIFDRLKPELLARLSKTAKPSEALMALDGFLAGLPAGVQLFSLLEANPQLIDLLVDIAGTSPTLASHLSRNSAVFDAVIGGSFFDDWPGTAALQADLSLRLSQETDYEAQLDGARRWCKEWHFRIGVHFLRGLTSAQDSGAHYAQLAEAVIAALCPVVVAQFASKHGPPPGRGAAVLAMGSLGSGQINAQSDLDIIVIYDPLGEDMSQGKRSLATRPYYARMTQALITALTAPMAQGRLYEVDMRLRPSGSKGPVATSWGSFTHYQKNEAWVWEHLALTRARVVAGAPELAQDIEKFRKDVLSAPRDRVKILTEMAEMRRRLAAAKTPDGVWDAKVGGGRMMDIELTSQVGALLEGNTIQNVGAGLQATVASGWLQVADATYLHGSYDLFWSVQTAARLLSSTGINTANLGEGGAQFLCRSTGFDSLEHLQDELERRYEACNTLIASALKREGATLDQD